MKKFSEVVAPTSLPTKTNRSMRDTPVTISGFIMGIFVTVISELLKSPRRIRNIATAAAVPRTVAITAESAARISVFFTAVTVSPEEKISPYHLSEKP